jgi:hypothetical protein
MGMEETALIRLRRRAAAPVPLLLLPLVGATGDGQRATCVCNEGPAGRCIASHVDGMV